MSRKELNRKRELEEVKAGRLCLKECALRVGLSYRQIRRVYRRFCQEGDAGLVHRSRGRRSNRAKSAAFKSKVVERYKRCYKVCGALLASEKLAKEGLVVDHETLRRWLLAEGLLKRHRRRSDHREQRPRKARFGELVQMDGSIHRWFGSEGDETCLMTMIDDATGERLALMDTGETTELAMRCLWMWIERYGIPKALYTDKKSVFITEREPTIAEQLEGVVPMTAFGKACSKLGITIIPANSPQAKGRVERSHRVYQDRFVKELKLLGVTTIKGANKLLQNEFNDELNTKFCHEPTDSVDAHRPLPKNIKLADIFCHEYERTVQNDWTVRFDNNHYQIEAQNRPLPRPRQKVIVRIRLDKSMDILYKDKPLAVHRISQAQLRAKADRQRATVSSQTSKKTKKTIQRPTKTPWTQNCTLMFAEPPKKKKR